MEKVLENGIKYQTLLCVAKIVSWKEAEVESDTEEFVNLECRVTQQIGEQPKESLMNDEDLAELGIDIDLMQAQSEVNGMRCQVLINATELAEQMDKPLSDDYTLDDFCDSLIRKKILTTIVRVSIKEFSSKLQDTTFTHIVRESTGNRSNCVKTARFGNVSDTDELAENMIARLLTDLEDGVCTPVLLSKEVQQDRQQDRRNRR